MARDRRGRSLGKVTHLVAGGRYRDGIERIGIIPGSDRAKHLARAMRQLKEAATLPMLGDQEAWLSPVWRGWSRRVPGDNLWILYSVSADGEVRFRLVIDTPPEPA